MTECIHRYLVYDSSPYPTCRRNLIQRKSIIDELRRDPPELGIILWGDWCEWLYRAGVPWRVVGSGGAKVPLATHTYYFKGFSPDPRDGFSTEQWMSSLRCIGLLPESPEPRLTVPNDASLSVGNILDANGIVDADSLCVIHPFGASASRWWPMEEAIKLITRLNNDKTTTKCVLVGGDRESEEMGKRSYQWPANTVNLSGKLTLMQLAALFCRAQAIVTTDSGPLHLAGALCRPTIGLFRAIRLDQLNCYPSNRFVGVWCNKRVDCQNECSWEHCQQWPCKQMGSIRAEQVFDRLSCALRLEKKGGM